LLLLSSPNTSKFLQISDTDTHFVRELHDVNRSGYYCIGKFRYLKGLWMLFEERIVGSIAISNIIRGPFQSCYLGYRMDGKLLNRGLMTEGLKAIIVYAFDEMNLHRIEANIMPRNAASKCRKM
jgi:[ribosomal protein S5]-alanine N-acetyltransferase